MALSYTEYQMAQQDLMTLRSREASYQIAVIQANKEREAAQAAGNDAAADAASVKAARKEEMLELTRQDIAKTQAQIDEFNGSPSVKSESTYNTEQKYANSESVLPQDPSDETSTSRVESEKTSDFGRRIVPGVSAGAMPAKKSKVQITMNDINGNKMGKDLRVKIMVPSNYLTEYTTGLGDELGVSNLHGIVFPYTPSISVEYKADYTSQQPLHSNFPINFYQKSSVGSISINGKFSVENAKDAAVYIATTHLLKALTRMKSGGTTGDHDSGSPPPVCRLFAHGTWMFNNVPVAITSFRVELPDNVDYFTMKDTDQYEMTSVPTMSTIALTLLPMYSRNEMLDFNVTDYIGSSDFKKRGYL
jgi:hypothetical protein